MGLVAAFVVAALILVNAVYVAAEFAAVSVRRSRIQQLAADGNPLAAWLLPILESPASLDRYIGACQIGITLSSLILGAYAQATLAVWLQPYFQSLAGMQEIGAQSTSAAVVLLVLTVGQVIFGELIPKSLALQYPTPTALYTLLAMVPSQWLYRPFIKWLNGTGVLIIVGPRRGATRTSTHSLALQEIALLIAESRDGGLLGARRAPAAYPARPAPQPATGSRQVMVPRQKIAAVDVNTPLQEVISIVAQRAPYSRLPVYRDSIDNIVGLVHTKDSGPVARQQQRRRHRGGADATGHEASTKA